MYDMYPEWGPAHLDEDHPANQAHWSLPVPEPVERRERVDERPDDN